LMIYALFRAFGHYYVEGVGYSTVQNVLLGGLASGSLLGLLFVCKLTATCLSLGSGSSGGIFSPSLFMGATLGAAFGTLANGAIPWLNLSIPGFAIVGMAAMVGGATGAAMTAVTMIFEMTRDYDIVMPMIVAVALSIGIRRVLSQENIYTIKLVSRRHFIPKALHANMFLVRQARDVMDREILLREAGTRLDSILSEPERNGKTQHVIAASDDGIMGVLHVNSESPREPTDSPRGTTLGDAASRNFTIVREEDVMFSVIGHIWQRGATMAVVVRANDAPRASDVLGVITKEHVADSVAVSIGACSSINRDRSHAKQ
jgi:CIC family chloride channel protein